MLLSIVIGAVCLLLILPSRVSGSQAGNPLLADPAKFTVELYVDLAQFGRLKAFQLTLSDGKQGFRRGLYLTSGPARDDRSDRLVYIDSHGKASIARGGFVSNETMVFARGKYGKGMLVTEPLNQRIVRVQRHKSLLQFAKLGTAPFGPAGLFYGPDGNLYATDFSGARLLRVSPQGKTQVFATVPVPDLGPGFVAGVKGGGFGGGGGGRDFLVSVFTGGPQPTGRGAIYLVSTSGRVRRIFEGMDGLQLVAQGPGGAFGRELFVPSVGLADNGDGGLYTLDSKRRMRPFMTGVDAVSVVFDTSGVLGGGMFVSDINDAQGAGKVWRVMPACAKCR